MNKLKAALVLLALSVSSNSSAWDSQCYQHTGTALGMLQQGRRCNFGSDVATGRLRGGSGVRQDEHRQIYHRAATAAGLPSAALQTHELLIFTESESTFQPTAFDSARTLRTRYFSPDELAMLPDFSFSLTDWVTGNETCPPDPSADPTACHNFESHIGALNSSHFPPQAQSWYLHYHNLALQRAAACRPLIQAFETDARFRRYAAECQFEALALEAVAQHFQQDQWSIGHMWERWGSSDLSAAVEPQAHGLSYSGTTIERVLRAGIVSGMIHGMEPWLTGKFLGNDTLRTGVACDSMCCPDDDPEGVVRFNMNGRIVRGAGDDHASKVFGSDERFSDQGQRALSCSAMSIRAVYAAFGNNTPLGDLNAPSNSIEEVDPTGDACSGMRVTNEAFALGLDGAWVDIGATAQRANPGLFLRMMARGKEVPRTLAGRAIAFAADSGGMDDIVSLAEAAAHWARENPTGSEMAAMTPIPGSPWRGAMFGAPPNRVHNSIAPYADSAPTATSAIGRAFHRGQANEHCQMSMSDLEALRAHNGQPPSAACAEIVERHLRWGTADSHRDIDPLCYVLRPGSAVVYQAASADPDRDAATDLTDPVAVEGLVRRLATAWCNDATSPSCEQQDCGSCVRSEGCSWCNSSGRCAATSTQSSCANVATVVTQCTDCSGRTNCGQCLEDAHCGWCQASNVCGNLDNSGFAGACGDIRDLPSECQ